MSAVWNALDNREKALLVWFLLLVVGVLSSKGLRPAVAMVVKALAVWPLGALFLGAVAYVALIVLVGAALGVWTVSLLGVTLLWFFGPAAVMFFNSNAAARDSDFFRKAVRGSVRWVLVVEFLVNLYVFNLVIELILLPVVSVLVLMAAVAETRPEFEPARKLLNFVLGVFGITLLARVLIALVGDFDTFATSESLMRFVLPPALTIAFLPYVYLLRLFIRYEDRRFDRRWREGLAAVEAREPS